MSVEIVTKDLEDGLQKALEHLKDEFAHLQIGRASASLVERIVVESYGVMQPLKAIASISVPDTKTIQIQPWDRSTLVGIEKAILMSDIGLTPNNNGVVIRLNIPPLTEERRKELAKVVLKMAEEAKIAVRNLRHEAMEQIKSMKNNNQVTEDQQELAEKKIQEKVDAVNVDIEHAAKQKENDIMTI
jgi:ribosome recycling factor